MTLPELSTQVLYGRLAWALVLAALLAAPWAHSRRAAVLALAAMLAWNALPGAYSPSYWLALAFQLPSSFLAALCALRLWMQWQGRRALAVRLPLPLCAPLALAAVVLYLDALGLLALGWYYRGFGPLGAPLVALLLAAGAAWGVAGGKAANALPRSMRPYLLALLAALCGFAVLRLPSGNLWDALLDPFLAAWALVSLVVTLWRRLGMQPLRHSPR